MEKERGPEKHHEEDHLGSNRGDDRFAYCDLPDEVIPVKKVTLHLNGKTYEVSSLAQAVNMILQEGKKAGGEDAELWRR